MAGIARVLRKRSTKAERTVWRWLRNRTLFGYKFRRQHPVGRFVLDFYCAELKLCVELDGGIHGRSGKAAADGSRSNELSKSGIVVVRVNNDDVFHQPDAKWDLIVAAVVRLIRQRTGKSERQVLDELYALERAHHPSPWPSPRKRGEGTGAPGTIEPMESRRRR